MKKRIVSLLLTLIMVFGMLPAGMVASAEEPAAAAETIAIDFKETVKAMAQEDFWQDLPTYKTENGYDTKRIGTLHTQNMTADQVAAYGQLQVWLEENESWSFRMPEWEKTSGGTDGERLYLCADDNIPWGMTFHTYYIGSGTSSRLELNVKAETAGYYNLKLDIDQQDTGSTDSVNSDASVYPGGAYIDVYVNGLLARENYPTQGTTRVQHSMGQVWLEEGNNAITIENAASIQGWTSEADGRYGNRVNTCLCGMELVPVTGENAQAKPLSIDFKKTAKAMAQEDFWQELTTLTTATGDTVKRFGSLRTPTTMSEEEAAEYAVQRTVYPKVYSWLAENENWNFNMPDWIEGPTERERVYLSDSDATQWGLTFHTYYIDSGSRNRLELNVTAEASGWYALQLDVVQQNNSSLDCVSSDGAVYAGGAYIDVYVNNDLVREDYATLGAARVQHALGQVYLEEGTNLVAIEVAKNSAGKTNADGMYGNRTNVPLRAINFIPLTTVKVSEFGQKTIDLLSSYLPYDTVIDENTCAVSSSERIVKAALDNKGKLTLQGVMIGEAQVTIMQGDTELCTIDVNTVEFEGELDELGGIAVTLDLVDFARTASQQDWYAANTEEGMELTADTDRTDMAAWMDENVRWSVDALDGQLLVNSTTANYGLGVDGTVTLSYSIPAEGLYGLTLSLLQRENGGSMDVFINDEAVYENISTDGPITVKHYHLGAVALAKGENTVTIVTDDAAALRTLTFAPLGTRTAEEERNLYLDLTDTYLPFDYAVSVDTFAVASNDEAVATAFFDEDGYLVVNGLSQGTCMLTVAEQGETVCKIPVQVVAKSAIAELVYTLDRFTDTTMRLGDVAEGDVTALTANGVPIVEKQLRTDGAVYFKSSDISVVTVDQATGDVTCVGEGAAVITAYANDGENTYLDEAKLTVSDDADLAAITIASNADYVGTGNSLQLYVQGVNASGAKADMSLYHIMWSLDEESEKAGIASISESGRLTACEEGTVIVTATVGVAKMPISDSITIDVVNGALLPGEDLIVDFTSSKVLDLPQCTLEKDGYAVDWENTYQSGKDLQCTGVDGLSLGAPKGESLSLLVSIKKSGWYRVEVRGRSDNYSGCLASTYIDDIYVGAMDFGGATTNADAGGMRNTVYLEAGTHTVRLTSEENGSIMLGRLLFHAAADPRTVEAQITADRTELLAGETAALTLQALDVRGNPYYLKHEQEEPAFTNYYILTSSDPSVISVSTDMEQNTTLTANAAGTAVIEMTAQVLGEEITDSVTVAVKDGSIATAELTAEQTTVRPGADPISLTLTAYTVDGTAVDLPQDAAVTYTSGNTAVAAVSPDGIVTLRGGEGSCLITATVVEGSHTVKSEIWIIVTAGKTEPTIYTYEERANAQENVLKYDWAWSEKELAVSKADYYLENLDIIYNMWPREGFPRSTRVGWQGDDSYVYCRYCGADLKTLYGHYPWAVDPIKNPWKITCRACGRDFPSNDFESYYKSGLDERGYFHAENADSKYLVNELYPEMGEGWGVDAGWGYDTGTTYNGTKVVHMYIAHYLSQLLCGYGGEYKHSIQDIFGALTEAYLYTGDEKYGNAGAILIDRVADIYPEYFIELYDITTYLEADGNSGQGRFMGSLWESGTCRVLIKAADAFWPCMENTEVVDYLKTKAALKGLTADDITPDQIRLNVEENFLLEVFKAAQGGDFNSNFGTDEAAVALAAVCLDRLPETQEMLDWIWKKEVKSGSGTSFAISGGDVMPVLINDVDRDGFGNEVSLSYNALWETYLIDLADALNGYTRVENVDLWKNSKFVSMYLAMMKLTLCGEHAPAMHETASPFQSQGTYANVEKMLTAFINTGDRDIARALYARNGNTTVGLHGDIFTKDPESGVRSAIEKIVAEDGVWNMSESNMLCGYGIAILREGPEVFLGTDVNGKDFSDIWMYFGFTDESHAQLEALGIDIEAFGLTLSGNMGYPEEVISTSAKRMQWYRNTVSNNTVVVNDTIQSGTKKGGFPLHFEDAGYAKVMDAESAASYPETDIYRRTLVTVDNGEGVNYTVDFFRVLGGSEHVYSYHGATTIDPMVTGLEMVEQPFGTYAGADIPYGDWDISGTGDASNNQGSGYSWLYNVSRDDTPDTTFSIDWAIEDFNHQLTASDGIHLKLTMLSEKPYAEVALADGEPSTAKGKHIDHVEFVLIRNSGEPGLDTLFTAVLEPYQYNSYIASAELVDVELIEGTELPADRAACVKTTLVNGRVDYIVYATNADCTYSIDNGKFTFQGFTGVCSYEDGVLIYAWGNEVTTVDDAELGAVIEDALPAVTGKVVSFTEGIQDHYYMTVEMDTPVTEAELKNRYIYVNNDGVANAAYRIYGAEVSGNTAVLDLYHTTLVRQYIDDENLELGYVHNISVNDTYSIPLSAVFDVAQYLNYTADQVAKTGAKMSLNVGVAGSGATYEAEGLVSGMKFNSTTGVLTWTPSRTQTGRYPITVTAYDADGKELGTMSFVIYVVSYTGSTYDNSVCSHSKAVTYTVGNVIETVCPACKTVIKETVSEEEIEKFDVVGTSMSLDNALIMNFMVDVNDLDTSRTYTARITHGDETVEQELRRYNSLYWSVSHTVAAAEMADTVTVEVYDEDGNAVSNVYEKSVRGYAMGMLAKSTSAAKLKTLCVDLLNYGAAAQKHFGVNTGDLANKELTEAQKALGTQTITYTNKQVKGKNFVGTTLSLEENIQIKMFFSGVTEGMYAKVSYTGLKVTENYRVEYSDFVSYGSYLGVYVDTVVPADAAALITVTMYNADGTVYGEVTDSIESYCARMGQSELNDAIMKFASSARAFLS